MNEKFPKKISRRSFLSSSGKLAIGAAGILAGSAGLFYYGAATQKEKPEQERPGHIVALGLLSQLKELKNVEKASYKRTIQDVWVTKEVNGFVHVRNDVNGDGAEFDISGNAVGVVTQGLDTYKPIISESTVYIDILNPIKGQMRKLKGLT